MPGLKPAAREYVRSALAVLEEREAQYEDDTEWLPDWTPLGEFFLFQTRRLKRFEACLQGELRRLPDSRESKRFREALRGDRRISQTIAEPAGRIDEDTLARTLIWKVARKANGLAFSNDAFESGYANWLQELTASTHPVRFVAPLHPLEFAGRVELENGVEIAQLSDDEVVAALRMEAIHSFAAGAGVARVGNRAAVRIEYRVPRGLSDQLSDEERQASVRKEEQALRSAEAVVEALRVFAPGRVAVRGQLFMGPAGSLQGGPVAAAPLPGEPVELDNATAAKFAGFWRVCKEARRNKVLDAAIRRFSYAGERARRDDEIVDLVASLETLLLSEIERPGEHRFETALRGAFLIEPRGLTRLQVQTQLRRAYDVRSAVAHGKSPRDAHLRGPEGEPLDLDGFVTVVGDLVRLAILRAVAVVRAGRAWPPDWDAVVLEGARP